MSDKLDDPERQLTDASAVADRAHRGMVSDGQLKHIHESSILLGHNATAAICAELRARRAADLTDEEREALASLRSTIEITGAYGSKANRALAALDKILGGKP